MLVTSNFYLQPGHLGTRSHDSHVMRKRGAQEFHSTGSYHIFRNISRTFDHQIRLQFLRCDLYSESTENGGVVIMHSRTLYAHARIELCYSADGQL